jgi:Bacterial proteasome activator
MSSNPETNPETAAPEVVQAVPVEPVEDGAERPQQETITEPAKLLRIASMVRELLDETRQASLDEAGRKRLTDVYHRAVDELSAVLSGDLQEELAELAPPLEGVPTESEIRVAQAQLVGWLEGLFHGIQAAMFAQQAAARAQFEELRRRGLPGQGPQQAPDQADGQPRSGQYL